MTEQVALPVVAAAESAPRRRGRPGYDLEAVLQVAVEVFNERGYDGASMEDLSRRLGIAKSGIYHHVSGKEELLRPEDELKWVYILHKVLSDMNPVEAMEMLTNRMARFKSNGEFLGNMNL